jgi:hypothetical protein
VIKKLRWSLNYNLSWRLTLGQVTLGPALLWMSPVLWLVPSPAAAYTAADQLTVYWLAGEDFTALARRAEATARTAAQQGFDADILLTRVVITVLGQNGGQTAPILKMDVSRNDWRSRPDPRYWSNYYRSTPALLGLEGVVPTGTLQANPAPAAAPAVPTPSPAPTQTPTPAPADGQPTDPANIPGNQPSSTSGSSTLRSPGRSTSRPDGSPNSTFSPAPGAAPETSPGTSPDEQPETVSPPAINLPAVPEGAGIPRSILR